MLPDVSILESLSDADLLAFRQALQPYSTGILGRAEQLLSGGLDAIRLPVVQAWLQAQAGPPAVLARLFGYHDVVPRAQVEAALPDLLPRLLAAGILVEEAEGLSSAYVVMPFEGVYVLSDEFGPDDPVMGPGATTYELARAVHFPGAHSVLDVGAGAGSLALVAAQRGVAKVIATDLSPRAVALTRFNARLAGVSLEARAGDLLAPVAGERFDLIVAQPPFVVRPDGMDGKTTLHGGAYGDELAMRLLAGLAEALAPNGRAVIRFDSPVLEVPLLTRVQKALGTEQLRITLLTGRAVTPEYYATGYASSMDPSLGADYRRYAKAYYQHLLAHHIERSSPALLVVDRRLPHYAASLRPSTLRRADHTTIALSETALALAAVEDSTLLLAKVRTQPSARIVQDQPLGKEPTLELRFASGVAEDQTVAESVAILLDAFFEGGTVEAGLKAYAAASEQDADAARSEVLGFVRDALRRGVLVPA